MHRPVVTIGIPVYRGADMLPIALESIKAQTYSNLDVLISVDGADAATFAACEPFKSDARFRVHLQPSHLGWASNMDWTIRNRRGEFYIYLGHDDWISPTYVADLLDAATKWPDATICFAEMQIIGTQNRVQRSPSTRGDPITRALAQMEHLDGAMLRGLIPDSALHKTAGILTNEFEGFGSEIRFIAELALAGDFRFVEGPTYYKALHGKNMHLRWHNWPEERRRGAWAALAAWMIEVIVPAGRSVNERRDLFHRVLERFLSAPGAVSWLRNRVRWLYYKKNFTRWTALLLRIMDRVRRAERFQTWMHSRSRSMLCDIPDAKTRTAMLQVILHQLRQGGRFDAVAQLDAEWNALEGMAVQHIARAAR